MGRKNPGMRRPPKAGSGGGWRMHIPLMAVQLLCGRLLTSPSSHVTTFPSQKGQPGTPRSVKLEWPGLVSLSRGHLSSVHLSVCPLLVTDLVWWCCSEQRARGRKEWPETGWVLSGKDLSHSSNYTRRSQPSGQHRSSCVSTMPLIWGSQPLVKVK